MPSYRILADGNVIVANKAHMDEVYGEGNYEEVVLNQIEETHVPVFPAAKLRDSFTTLEKIGALTSSDTTVASIARVLETSDKTIDSSDPLYQQYIQLLADNAIITQDIADSYMLGIPVERMP